MGTESPVLTQFVLALGKDGSRPTKKGILPKFHGHFRKRCSQNSISKPLNSFPLDNLPKFQILTGKLDKGAFG
ncbi:hypothetical protein EHQ23_04735 [Leptospira bourretii]|uniref:Uncharacterized protein n=1 Tax=Leptospira bourretii TaxID=2484962 RepID=A0A4R9IJ53_9LEPT|nr:hypothetical protein EHQ23_04735 [Leptospira bourretii]TGK89210.1 hypothetical protein EHQ26_17260 [Leptospira bourretii]TGL20708.1 hypothetical protein EHQ47_12440 [Leptospira bourretii]TGL27470.1 hypothetical protein EHQ45_17610 [Leptospira bourretii]